MAPIRSVPKATAGGVGKKVHRKRVARREPSDSWELLDRQGMDPNAPEDVMEDNDEDQPAAIDGPAGVDEAVTPLREMAERVGREVETFAETLDKFLDDRATGASTFDAVHDLVLDFKDIAERTVVELKQSHEREMRQQLQQEWSEHARLTAASTALKSFTSATSASLGARKAEQVKQLRQWQQEADMWDLFRIMLELHPFEAEAQTQRLEREERLARIGRPHRYTSEGDLWESFLLEDDVARERNLIKEWLERTAEHQHSDIPGIVEELEVKAGRGKGLWSSGWLHTREKIKGEKRLRSWPDAADSPLPQIRRSDNNELLVTTLDPDAPARQQRTLEKPDSYFERAMWIACWEMLRRGKSPAEVCDWCEERKEGWRAVCLGAAMDNTEATVPTAAWRQMCLLASQAVSSSDYEAAVLGRLGGNLKAMEKVCRSLDDRLYAYYSAALTQAFDQYVLTVCPDKATPQAWRRNTPDVRLHDPEHAENAIKDLINRLRMGPTTRTESAQPMKIIQSYVLADEVGSLIHTVGAAIAETAALQGPEDMIYLRNRRVQQNGASLPEAEVGLDPQTLRIAAHMSVVYRTLSPDHLQGQDLLEDENVLVAYIQALRAAGKRDLIPIYASKLQRPRYIVVLGRILQDITDHAEQTEMLRLMFQYDLDVLSTLVEQQNWVLDHFVTGGNAKQSLRILEDTDETKLHPGQRIRVDFEPDEVESDDDVLVRCLQWWQLLEGEWKDTFESLTMATRRCLVTNRFAWARMIIRSFPYEEVSTRKSYQTIGRSINMMEITASTPYEEEESMTWDLMKRQSRTYFELEQLVHAIETLFAWRQEEQKYLNKIPKPATVPTALKRAKEAVSEAMQPLLKGILQNPTDEKEASDLAHIRKMYIPEIIIAYNTVLHAAGNLITRDSLLESMDLSTTIATGHPPRKLEISDEVANAGATKQPNGLVECFVQAERMRELVSSFALTSKVMLILKAEGKPWRPKKDRVGKDLGIWEIGNAGGRESVVGEVE